MKIINKNSIAEKIRTAIALTQAGGNHVERVELTKEEWEELKKSISLASPRYEDGFVGYFMGIKVFVPELAAKTKGYQILDDMNAIAKRIMKRLPRNLRRQIAIIINLPNADVTDKFIPD